MQENEETSTQPATHLSICDEHKYVYLGEVGQLDGAGLAHEEGVGLLACRMRQLAHLLRSFQVAGHPERPHHDACSNQLKQ